VHRRKCLWCTVYTGTLRKEMFLVIVQKQQQYVTGHASFWAVSSKTSDWLPTYVVSRWDGITSWWLAAKRRWRLEAVVETGMQHAARYREAEPYRHRRVITPSEFVLDTLSYVKPVELSMHQLPQTAVELPWLTNWQPHPCTAVSPQYICVTDQLELRMGNNIVKHQSCITKCQQHVTQTEKRRNRDYC